MFLVSEDGHEQIPRERRCTMRAKMTFEEVLKSLEKNKEY
mgnify:CR=1 FL=1